MRAGAQGVGGHRRGAAGIAVVVDEYPLLAVFSPHDSHEGVGSGRRQLGGNPGAGGVRGALEVADSAAARQQRIDSLMRTP